MSVSLRTLRSRINVRIRNTDPKRLTYTTVEVDQAICDAYLTLQAQLPGPELVSASAFTISSGASTFTLPASVTQWTGNDGQAEYQHVHSIQLVSTGDVLRKVTWEELMAFREGHPTLPTHRPRLFALQENKTQGVTGYLECLSDAVYVCDLVCRMSADDLRDFVGSGSDDLDDVELQLSRVGAMAVQMEAAASLLEQMDAEDLKKRRLSGKSVAAWRKDARDLAYQEAARRHDLKDVGRQQRWVS